MTRPLSLPPPRLIFIDALRLIAAVQMIEGHTVAALLAPSYRTGVGFHVWSFARGLTSVMFLFSAGFALALAEARAHDAPARRRRAGRALGLLLLGYTLHAPLAVLVGAPLLPALRAFAAVDVLQCIAVSLLSLELLCARTSSTRGRVASSLSLAALCFSCAPSLRELSLGAATLVPGNYLTSRQGSLFPLFPWTGYVAVGFALGSLSLGDATAGSRADARTSSPRPPAPFGRLARWGTSLLGAGALLQHLLPAWPHAVHPGYALLKLGCVVLLASLLSYLLRDVPRLPPRLARLASETLFLYASHVLILYADRVGLAVWLGPEHAPWFGALVALGLLVVCSFGALALGSLRGRSAGGTTPAQSP